MLAIQLKKTFLVFIIFFTNIFNYVVLGQDTTIIINDVSQLNPTYVHEVIAPSNTLEIIEAVKKTNYPISIGGGRYSMGGQIALENSLHIDMRNFDSIISFSEINKEITVQAGITWRKIQEFIDPYNLSVSIMQTYANFTVGGSLSVNVHGRYIGQGPIILSVKQLKIVLANGELITASPTINKEIFYGAIGGYGGLGIITESTLILTDNVKVERTDQLITIDSYKKYFLENIRNDSLVIFHNADIYPNSYEKLRVVSYRSTTSKLTVQERLKPLKKKYSFNQFVFKIISDFPAGKWIRKNIVDPIIYIGNPVEWRNYEASYDARELEPMSRKNSTYILQEYFVPVAKFDEFYPLMTSILKKHNPNVINISIRHSVQDPGSLLSWANSETFAFVIYYKQGTKQYDKEQVKIWTRELINAAISCNGTYYLPYQIYASNEQFKLAYPKFNEFYLLKKELDPTNKFRNTLWDTYYK